MMPVVTSYAAFKRMGDDARAQYLAERRALGMTDVDIYKEAGFCATERRRAHRFLTDRGQAVPMCERKASTLCWDCRRPIASCPWLHEHKPVAGWDAVPTVLYCRAGQSTNSYHVISCPLFVGNTKRK